MPVYNAERYLQTAIESILSQTFRDFDFIIINDGSVDSSSQIVEAFDDPRIRYYQNDGNQGIVVTLNRGLSLAQGRYIARMDADDIALPDRLQMQVAYMDCHPAIGALGTNTILVDESGNQLRGGRPTYPTGSSETVPGIVKWNLLWAAALSHPTVMLRRQLLIDINLAYDPDYEYTEDYDFWTRVSKKSDITYLPQPLLLYRVNPTGMSNTSRQRQQRQTFKITQREIRDLLGEEVDTDSLEALHLLIFRGESDLKYDYESAAALLKRIYYAFLDRYPLSTAEKRALRHKLSTLTVAVARRARGQSHLASSRILWHHFVRYPMEFPHQVFAKLRKELKQGVILR